MPIRLYSKDKIITGNDFPPITGGQRNDNHVVVRVDRFIPTFNHDDGYNSATSCIIQLYGK